MGRMLVSNYKKTTVHRNKIRMSCEALNKDIQLPMNSFYFGHEMNAVR